MTPAEWEAIACTGAACVLLAWLDPAERLKAWFRSRRRAHHATGRGKPGTHAQAPGEVGHLNVELVRGEGAAPAVVAPSPPERVYVQVQLTDAEIIHINRVMEWRFATNKERVRA